MKYRKDKKRLRQELKENVRYQRMKIDSLEVLSVMLNAPMIWEERGKFMLDGKKEECNMCLALQEWAEEERSLGRAEGKVEGASEKMQIIVRNMLSRGMIDEDIKALAECSQEFVDEVRESAVQN